MRGVAIPGVIHNSSYFLTDVVVYEDGLISCWHAADLESVATEIDRGWLVSSIPDTKSISIHGLGRFRVANGSWLHDKSSFLGHIRGIVRHMNPEMKNLYEHVETKVNGVMYLESGRGHSYREMPRRGQNIFPAYDQGDSLHLYCKIETVYRLVRLTVFRDSSVEVAWNGEESFLSFSEFEAGVSDGLFLTEVPIGSRIEILGLGSFEIGAVDYVVSVENKILEMADMIRSLNGEPTSLDICRTLYEEFLKRPTVELRSRLREAYEKIPEHNRVYVLRDMDAKDIPVRMIIYGNDEIENWSHRAAARAMGLDELPTIEVPSPKDE